MRTANSEPPSLIVPFAKQRGKTSFASLSVIKNAFGTNKVGHTGTLDSFADGLLVVLTGRLTRLVPHITRFDKTYLALVRFGTETDTLDPTGAVVRTGAIPSREQLERVIPQFVGTIAQVPPLYSAIHVGGGQRASDLARAGKTAAIPARNITVYDIRLHDCAGEYALLEVRCSKGTYIRALARDIAVACGSCAHLAALRRTAVGPFTLSEAAGADDLGDFSIAALTKDLPPAVRPADTFYPKIRAAARGMDDSLAECCGFVPVELTAVGANAYANGRPLKKSFAYYPVDRPAGDRAQLAVFYPRADGMAAGAFGGVVEKNGSRLSYGFVIPREKTFAVYRWEQVAAGRFPAAWTARGTALTVGSFDGPHRGHEALFRAVLSQEHLVSGVVVFSRSLRALKHPDGYAGDVATLAQKLAFFERVGFAFAVVVDFTADFAAMPAADFLFRLADGCALRFLAEGEDFRCGCGGAAGMAQVREFGRERQVAVAAVAPVLHGGEKISSSRIRAAVCAGDMDGARALLGRPFALDCAGWDWKRDGQQLTARKAGIQVLPKDGDYAVAVLCSRGAVETACAVRAGMLRLRNADGAIGGCIREIRF